MSIEKLINNKLIDFNDSLDNVIGRKGKCTVCKENKETVRHHISYKPENIMHVCQSCHGKIHHNEEFRPDLTPELSRMEAAERGYVPLTGYYKDKENTHFTVKIKNDELAEWVKNEVDDNDNYHNINHLFELAISRFKDNTYDDIQRRITRDLKKDIYRLRKIRNNEFKKLSNKSFINEELSMYKLDIRTEEWINFAFEELDYNDKSDIIDDAISLHRENHLNTIL